jgi:hypothetical protein
VFAKGGERDADSRTPQQKSALCVYSLKDIDEVFKKNIVLCNSGGAVKVNNVVKQCFQHFFI